MKTETPSPTEQLPAAWLGIKSAGLVSICAWCSDCRAAEELARKRHLRVTHGICTHHHQKKLEELKLD